MRCKPGKHESSQVKDLCERLFNKRFELDELKNEIAEKAFFAVSGFADVIGEKIGVLLECFFRLVTPR
jgi:hypothetical protein